MYTTQFEIANVGIEEIKQKVNTWLTKAEAVDYYLEVVNDRHVKAIKTRHDSKICVYGCIGLFGGVFLGAFVMVGLSAYMGSAGLFLGLIIMLAIIIVCMPLTYGYFFLKPNKVEYDLTVSGEYPVHITLIASGNLLPECQHEYNSFLNALKPGYPDAGPGLAF